MFPNEFDEGARELTWQAQEVVRDVDHRPHLLVRITVRGRHFPHRALVPFLRLMHGREVAAQDWFTEIADDEGALVGYFPTDVPDEGEIEFGYFPQVLGRVPARFDARQVRRLAREGLGEEVVVTTTVELERRRRGS